MWPTGTGCVRSSAIQRFRPDLNAPTSKGRIVIDKQNRLVALVIAMGTLILGAVSERVLSQGDIYELTESVKELRDAVQGHTAAPAHAVMQRDWDRFLVDRETSIEAAREERDAMMVAIFDLTTQIAVLASTVEQSTQR